jgi:hypothetical protein
MIKFYNWFLSHLRRLVIAACVIPLVILLAVWLLRTFPGKSIATWIFVVIWFGHVALGAGAGYAALRLWYSRHHPLIGRLGLYINAFIIDVLSAIVLLFVARGVTLTWKFATVMFVSTLLSDVIRAPLILYLIRGPAHTAILPSAQPTSGALPPEEWMERIRKIVREEVADKKHEEV